MKEVAETKTAKKFFTMERTKSVLSVLFIILVTFQIGVVVGWNARSADYGRTQTEASAIVQAQLKVQLK